MVVHNFTNTGMIARPATLIRKSHLMKPTLIAAAELDRLDTWQKYSSHMCGGCVSSCCTTPIRIRSLIFTSTGSVQQVEIQAPHIGAEYFCQVSRRSTSAAAIKELFIVRSSGKMDQGARSYRHW